MKELLSILVLAALAIAASAQTEPGSIKLPDAVTEAFKESFPDINVWQPDWSTDGVEYRADFDVAESDLKETSIVLNKKGELMFTEVEMNPEGLPGCYTRHISVKFPGSEIQKASLVTLADNEICYGVQVEDESLLFDSSCRIMEEDGMTVKR